MGKISKINTYGAQSCTNWNWLKHSHEYELLHNDITHLYMLMIKTDQLPE